MKKILVLPFLIHPRSDDSDYLCDGILEELIDLISSSRKMRASSRSISLYLQNNPSPGKDLAREFGIDLIIEGSIKRRGAEDIITMRLIGATTEDVLKVAKTAIDLQQWTKALPALLDELFEGQSPASELTVGSGDSKVRELYLKGIYHWNRYTHEEMKLAIHFFKKALQVDATYAPAYAGLANSYAVMAVMGYETIGPSFEKSKEYVTQALKYNDKHSDSYVCAAMINLFHELDFPRAKINLDNALRLNRHNVKAHHFMAFYGAFSDQLELGERHARIALEEDPLSTPHHLNRIRFVVYRRNFAKALEYLDLAYVVDPESVPLMEFRAMVNMLSGNLESAIEEFKHIITLAPHEPLNYAYLAYSYSLANFHHDSREVEDALAKARPQMNVAWYHFSSAIIKLGRKDYAAFFRLMHLTLDEGMRGFAGDLLHNPVYSEIRKDKRYSTLLERFGLNPGNYRSRKKIQPASILTISSNTKEELTLDPQDIAFVQGEGNYCTIYWHQDGVLQHQILRVTLKQLETQLEGFTSIVRCHKSYMVNLNEDLHLAGNARAYFIDSPFFPVRIPISRGKKELVERLTKR